MPRPLLSLTLVALALCSSELHAQELPVAFEDRIVALVNGEAITRSVILQRARLLRNYRVLSRSKDPRAAAERAKVEQQKLAELAEEFLVLQAGRRLDVSFDDRDQQDLDATLARKAEPYDGLKGLEERLGSIGVSMKVYQRQLRANIMTGKIYFAAITRNLFIAPGEIRVFFEDNPELFVRPAKTRLRRIRLSLDPEDLTDAGTVWAKRRKQRWGDESCRRLGLELRQRLLSGEDAGELARRYSMRASDRETGGLQEFTSQTDEVAPVEGVRGLAEIADPLDEGQVSELAPAYRTGYQLVLLELRRRRSRVEFARAQEKIVGRLKEFEWQVLVREWMQGLKRDAKIELFRF